MSSVIISLIQTSTRWHDPAANRQLFSQWLDRTSAQARLVLLPEMFTTGFTMAPEQVFETMAGPTVAWLRAEATTRQKVIGGSVVIGEQGQYFNRFLWAQPDGAMQHYDKRHCFRMAGEHEHYAAGTARPVWPTGSMRVRPLVCYDLRFPVWLRRRDDYDLLACVANWPAARLDAWRTLLKARAIENQSYVAGVNILGRDGAGVEYAGGSVVYGPDGQCLLDAQDREGVFSVELDLDHLARYRAAFPAWQDADGFQLID
ncbi:MAG: amidohydrolase [Gammaproteobacteria bacterium]|nr:amidohydrolase [Gammaproteobacteria bacterium]